MHGDRLTGLDLLRALACLLVFLHHTTQRLQLDSLSGGWRSFYQFFNMGAFGVAIFFLLSGFLLARPFWVALDAGRPMPSLATYALRRAARIVPGFYLSLTLTVVVAATLFGTPFTPQIIQRYVAGLLFVGELHWLTLFPAEVNGPLWSIGMEVASYVLLPLGLLALFGLRKWLPGRRGRLVFVGVVVAALIGQWLVISLVPKETFEADFRFGMIGGAKYWMPEYNVFGFFAVFALGSLVAGFSTLWRGRPTLVADVLVVIGLTGAAMAMWSVSASRQPEAFGWLGIPYDFPVFHLAVALALYAFPHTRALPWLTELPPVRYFAKISFGIYIWHFLVLELVRQNFAPAFGYDGINSTAYWMELTGISFVLALVAGSLSWFGIEAPALNWAKRQERNETERALPQQNMHA